MTETALEKVLRLAVVNVRSFQRVERGREQNVRAHTETKDWIPQPKWREGQQIWKERGKVAASSAEHAARMRSLAGRVAFHNVEAARAIDRAVDAYTGGRHKMARGHLDNAAFLLRSSGHHDVAKHVESVRDVISDSTADKAAGIREMASLGPGKGETPLQAFQGQASAPSEAAMDAMAKWMRAHPQEAGRHLGG